MATRDDVLIRADALRAALTAGSIALLQQEDFERAQALTQAAREVKELGLRLRRVLGIEDAVSASASSDAGEVVAEPEGGYPRFYRQGDSVLKVALSRGRRTTYEQRCPRLDYEKVMAAVAEAARESDTIEASQIKARVTIPDYMVYLVLALLESLGHLEVPRRGLHQLRRTIGPGWADEVWRQIPVSSGFRVARESAP